MAVNVFKLNGVSESRICDDRLGPVACPAGSHSRTGDCIVNCCIDVSDGVEIGIRKHTRQRQALIRHIELACIVARPAVLDSERGEIGFDMVRVMQRFHRIGEINIAGIECLEPVDCVGIGIERPGLHLQVGTARLRVVTQPADHDVPAPIGIMEVHRKRVVAVVATFLLRPVWYNVHDRGVEVVLERLGFQVKGPGRSIEGNDVIIGMAGLARPEGIPPPRRPYFG